MTPQWGGHLRSREKSNTYLHLQKTREHQITDLQWESPILKAIWPFDHVTNERSLDSLKNLYFHGHKTYGQ